MAALTPISNAIVALAAAMAADTGAVSDIHDPGLVNHKASPGLRAAYLRSVATGEHIDVQGICARYGRTVPGADSLLVTLEPGAGHEPAGAPDDRPAGDAGRNSERPVPGAARSVLVPCREGASVIAGLTVTQCHARGRYMVVSNPVREPDRTGAPGTRFSARQLDALIANPAVRHLEADCRYAFTAAAKRPASTGCPQKFPCRAGSPGCAAPVSCAVTPPPALERWTDGKLWGPESMGALNVYRELPDMSDERVLIAVLDSGVFYEHSVFDGRIFENTAEAAGIEGIDDDGNGCVDDLHGCAFHGGEDCDHASTSTETSCDPTDLTGHGSMVAEVIVSLGPGTILPVRLGNARDGYSKSNYVAAIDYVDSIARGQPGLKTIVNLSQTIAPQMASAAIGEAIANSPSLFVIAAGNYGAVEYPAAYGGDNVIRVSGIGPHACDEAPALTSFVFNDQVDLTGPGTEICTSFGCRDDAPECLSQGTSLAAPHVTAAAAMYLHENPSATAQQTRAALIEHARAHKSVDISFLAEGPRRCACDRPTDSAIP